MTAWGIADAEQLAALARLLNEYSKEIGVAGDKLARDRVAVRIMCLFNEGITRPEDIRRSLDSSPSGWLVEQPLVDGSRCGPPEKTASAVGLKSEKSAA